MPQGIHPLSGQQTGRNVFAGREAAVILRWPGFCQTCGDRQVLPVRKPRLELRCLQARPLWAALTLLSGGMRG